MKKVNKKGFILAETIAISVVVITALVIIYTQFVSVDNSYYRTFNYNNVNDLYLVNQLREFILEGNNQIQIYNGINNENLYVDITDCSTNYFVEYLYCDNLISAMDVKQAIVTSANTTGLINNLSKYNFSENMKRYIKNNRSNEMGYNLIVEFNDNTIAGLKMNSSTKVNYNIGDIVTLSTGNDITTPWHVIKNNGTTLTLLKATNIDDSTYIFGNSSDYNMSNAKYQIELYGEKFGVPEITNSIRLITIEELESLGCVNEEERYNCSNAYPWILVGNYWTMSSNIDGDIWYVYDSAKAVEIDGYVYDHGIRPVIEVPIDMVK